MPKFTTTKLWSETLKKIRIIAAYLEQSRVATVEQLVDAEMKRLGISKAKVKK